MKHWTALLFLPVMQQHWKARLEQETHTNRRLVHTQQTPFYMDLLNTLIRYTKAMRNQAENGGEAPGLRSPI